MPLTLHLPHDASIHCTAKSKTTIRYLGKRHHVRSPSKQFLYLKKGRHREELNTKDQETRNQRRFRWDRRNSSPSPWLARPSPPPSSPASRSYPSPLRSRRTMNWILWEKRLESEIQGDQPRNSSDSKKPWKKIGVKEFPRDNNLWGHPLIPSSLTNSSPLWSQVPCPNQATTSKQRHMKTEKNWKIRGGVSYSLFFSVSYHSFNLVCLFLWSFGLRCGSGGGAVDKNPSSAASCVRFRGRRVRKVRALR